LLYPAGLGVKIGGVLGTIVTSGGTIEVTVGGVVMQILAGCLTVYGALIVGGKVPTPPETWEELTG